MLVCAEGSTFEFHRRLSQTRLGPWTIKFMKAHSELISKYILIHADLFSSWGLFITHCRFNIGLQSVITKDSMVGHNYIMQMTFAVLFELIPSDVSFFYHTPHTSVSLQWLCKPLLSWSPSSWCCLSRLSRRHGPLWGCGGCDVCLWHRLCWQLVGTGVHWFYHQMATHIWLPPNAQAWKTCSLHISLEIDWLFFDTAHCDCKFPGPSPAQMRYRGVSERTSMWHHELCICFFWMGKRGVKSSPHLLPRLQDPEDMLLHIFGVKTARGWLLVGKKYWRDKNILILR